MKICVVSSSVLAVGQGGLAGYGGLEQIAWLQAKGLAELGHEVSLVAPDGSVCPGVNVIHSGPAGKFDEKTAYQSYWKYLPDMECITDHSWNKWSYILKKEGRLKSPILGVMHAPVNTMYQSLPPVDKPCIVCISQDQAGHFEALFSIQAKTCYNGVDTNFYKSLGIPRSDRFLFLARYSSIKGPDLAIQACLQAGVGLDLIGDTTITQEPEYFQHCMRLAEQTSPGWDSSRGKQIRVMGGVSRAETVHWYSQAHCMIHPNQRFREPMGLAPCEAMGCGCPVIGWRFGALKETVQEGKSGWLVSSLNELVHTIDKIKNGISQDVRESSREWVVSKFALGTMVKRYESLCKESVETGGW